ncbi:FAD-dependent oxidoreductase [Bordetella sp. N]|uniref:FAD-dependent oxidoreductase n=1 Tax=Bordetella sp. N TaxID=1746199 RepID=UPI00070A4818|nr:FAD-dependent oxidoreductase [Bordetella sp. N]ALM83328.1 FAD/NAD(P)-binding oxidoreductase [Bordetella sp. N]
MSAYTHDLVIIGAGPAGMSAAVTARQQGLSVVVLDEQPRPGGQVYRDVTKASPAVARLLGPAYRYGNALARRYADSGAEVRPGSLVWDIAQDLTVTAQQANLSFSVRAPQLLIASGAMEHPSPLPGWTLPGVMNAGAAQIAMKTSASIPDGRAVLVGGGPLLLLVACQLLRAGGRIAGIVDTMPAGNRGAALPHLPAALGAPAMLAKGLGMLGTLWRAGVPVFRRAEDVRMEEADGSRRVGAVSFSSEGRRQRLDADVVLLHHGVVPNTQITRLLRVAHQWSDSQGCWHPAVDAWGETSLPGCRVAGDGAAIAGALAAEASGAIAALGAAVAVGRLETGKAATLAGPWRARLSRQSRIRPFLDALYRPPAWLIDCADDTLVCRCEEVTAGQVREMARLGCQGPNQTKFFSRCGMGPCQGRMCGLTVTQILARSVGRDPADVGAYRIRAPLKPVTLGSVAALAEPDRITLPPAG